jgi:hypothetical protein
MDLAEVKVYRKASDNFIYLKLMSEAQLGEVKVSTVFSTDGKGEVFEFYKVRNLPTVPYSMQSNWDVLNNYGWLRAVGTTQGVEIPIITPLTKRMAEEMVNRVQEVIQYIYSQGELDGDSIVQHVIFKV